MFLKYFSLITAPVCGRGPDGRLYFQVCQGIFRDQIFPAQRIVGAPGYASSNFDQGNLNYARGDVTQSGIRINQDLMLTWKNYGFFVKGTNNDGPDFVTTGFGQLPHDPDALGYQLDSPLTAITNTSSRIARLNDREPDSANQFGIQLKYYAESLNNGTDIGLYFANYHSRLPIACAAMPT